MSKVERNNILREMRKLILAKVQKTADEQAIIDGGEPGIYIFTEEDLEEIRIDSSTEVVDDNTDIASLMRGI